MKKYLLSIFLSASLLPVFSQSVNWGLKAGLNESTVNASGTSTKFNNLAGFHAGIFADYSLKSFSLQPALLYTQLGFNNVSQITRFDPSSASGSENLKITARARYNYLELPLNLLYNFKTGPVKVFAGGGPFIRYAFSGSSKTVSYLEGVETDSYEASIAYGNDNGKHTRTDFGLNAIAGLVIRNKFLLDVNYGWGLTNLLNGDPERYQNRALSISAGYEF